MAGVVIVGAGQAGYNCAESLRQLGYDGDITLIGDERSLPYQRPPLSKSYLLGETDAERLLYRPAAFYQQSRIAVRLGTRASAIERAEKRLVLATGERLGYDALVLATGARVRRLALPGADLDGLCYLRTIDDIDDIARRLAASQRVVVIGAGFIGLEFAAVAAKRGRQVTVLEAAERVMARILPPVLSDFFAQLHRAHGVEVVTAASVAQIEGETGRVNGVRLQDGRRFPADLVIAGIGVLPNVELAEASGLACANGILVDADCRTGDPAIYAIGDCAAYAHPFAGRPIRLESVQNAGDEARAAAGHICGQPRPYTQVPWFWSDQYETKLQMAGLALDCDRHVVRGDPSSGKFSVWHFRGDTLRAVSAIGRALDYIHGRKLLEAGISPTPGQAANEAFVLKSLLP
jgi:3-phenylpropionate/trans-cinnamate dioxygenase ferredoxin reductase subunit